MKQVQVVKEHGYNDDREGNVRETAGKKKIDGRRQSAAKLG